MTYGAMSDADSRKAISILEAKLWSILLLIALAIVAQGRLSAGTNDWTNVGPEGGKFRLLAVNPQNPGIIYAATDTGVCSRARMGAQAGITRA